MVSTPYIVYNAQDRSFFSILKKEIRKIAAGLGFSETKVGEVDIIVAEMTSNLVKHAGGGEILVCTIEDGQEIAMEILCIDNGSGISDPKRMTEDGQSTANTMGHGLGSIKRMSDVFQLYSLKAWGTIVLSRVYKDKPKATVKKDGLDVRMFVVSKPGEEVSGDAASQKLTRNEIQLFLGDGLGHGPDAHHAAMEAVKSFQACTESDPIEIIRHIHPTVKRTRGLVATAAVYDKKEKCWSIAGVGNISTRMYQHLVPKTLLPYNGTIGMTIPNTMKAQQIPLEAGQLLVMCSDGIRSRWDLAKYPGVLKCDLSILAAVIYKDHSRRTDDTSVLLAKTISGT